MTRTNLGFVIRLVGAVCGVAAIWTGFVMPTFAMGLRSLFLAELLDHARTRALLRDAEGRAVDAEVTAATRWAAVAAVLVEMRQVGAAGDPAYWEERIRAAERAL